MRLELKLRREDETSCKGNKLIKVQFHGTKWLKKIQSAVRIKYDKYCKNLSFSPFVASVFQCAMFIIVGNIDLLFEI